MKISRLVGIAILLLSLLGSAALAQTTVGGVKGTVRDPQSAVVPGASVTLLNTDTNVTRKVDSSSDGLYNFTNVTPGNYKVTVDKSGFHQWAGSLVLQVQQVAVVDAVLAVGTTTTAMEVVAVTPVIEAERSSISNVTESTRIREMPINGVSILQLFQLTPGVSDPGSYSPHVNGLNAGAAEVLQDGGSILDRNRGGFTRIQPSMDSVQEFAVDTNSSAQYSHPTTITMVTKSGTNGLHGSLFEKFRNNAKGLTTRSRGPQNAAAPLKRNDFGASAGGPVRIPKLYKGTDKTFWFFAYQGERVREYTPISATVPSQAMWDGDFSNQVDAQGHSYTIYDPLTTAADGSRQPFPGNKIASSIPRPQLFTTLAAMTPRPSNAVNPMGGTNYYADVPQMSGNNTYTGKIDHHFGDKDYIFGRFSIGNSASASYFGPSRGGGAPNSAENAFNSQGEIDHLYNGAISYTRMFSPTTVNEFVFSSQRMKTDAGGAREDVQWDTILGLANPLNEFGWPTISGGTNGDPLYGRYLWDSQNKNPERLTKFSPEDNLTLVRGKHEFKVGVRFDDERNYTRSAQMGQGRYGFNEHYTGLWNPASQRLTPFTGNGMASMLMGEGYFYKVQYARPYYYLNQKEAGAYFQDSWKVTPRLTLNYGFRWDYWTPYNETANRIFTMDMSQWQTTKTLITPAGHSVDNIGIPATLLTAYRNAGMSFTTADKAGLPARLFSSDKKDFAPRIGAAFRLNSKTVLRGSYGMYYWTTPNTQNLGSQTFSAPLNLAYIAEPDYWNNIDNYDVNHGPIPGETLGSNLVDIGSPQSTSAPFEFTPFSTNQTNSRVHSWNFTIEREIMPLTSLRVSYIGNHSGNLNQTVQLNAQESNFVYVTRTGQRLPEDSALLRQNSFWRDLAYRQPIGYANNNSIQANFQRRTHKGLQFQYSYVFSRDLSTADTSEGYASNPSAIVPDANQIVNGGSLADRLRLTYTNVAGVPKHQMNWNAIYDLPFGRGKLVGGTARGLVNQLIGNWQLAAMGGWHTGQWLTPNTSLVMLRNPTLSEHPVINFNGNKMLWFAGEFAPGAALPNYQPALVTAGPSQDGYVPVTLKDGTTDMVSYDPYNSMPRNFIQGPSQFNVDASLFKNIELHEKMRLRFTADAFNVLNHPTNVNPDARTGLIDMNADGNQPRTIQFSLRFDF